VIGKEEVVATVFFRAIRKVIAKSPLYYLPAKDGQVFLTVSAGRLKYYWALQQPLVLKFLAKCRTIRVATEQVVVR
jgi:hypothetical protein